MIALEAALAALARALGGDVISKCSILAPGPGHSANDRSLSVTPSDTAPDGFVVKSWAGDDWRDCREYVRAALNGKALAPSGPAQAPEHRDLWKNIWLRAKNPLDHIPRAKRRPEQKSPVELYLNGRELALLLSVADEVIRYEPRCRFGEEIHPAMIVLVRDIFTNRAIGIQRTALTRDGGKVVRNGKTLRMSLGKVAGSAIKIDDDADVTMGLVVGEGLETCMAARQLGFAPTWALGSVGGIEHLPVLDGIEGLTILAEADEPSRKAVQICFERWGAARRTVVVRRSTIGSDINDAIRGAA